MPLGVKIQSLLDPKRCWKEWIVTEGTLPKVQRKFLAEGIINERTGNAPTISAIEKSAFSWAIKSENHAEARKDLEYYWSKKGVIVTDEVWETFLADSANLLYYQRPLKLQSFLEENGLG
jgi:hypothetical protein